MPARLGGSQSAGRAAAPHWTAVWVSIAGLWRIVQYLPVQCAGTQDRKVRAQKALIVLGQNDLACVTELQHFKEPFTQIDLDIRYWNHGGRIQFQVTDISVRNIWAKRQLFAGMRLLFMAAAPPDYSCRTSPLPLPLAISLSQYHLSLPRPPLPQSTSYLPPCHPPRPHHPLLLHRMLTTP